MACNLAYIPEYLRQNGRVAQEKFSVGEHLYYRSDPAIVSRPYDRMSLKDISHNRSFDGSVGVKDDVLYSVKEEEAFERYENLSIADLVIVSIVDNLTYTKKFTSIHEVGKVVTMTLKHDPVCCMYPHSVFEIKVGDEILIDDNYDRLLGKKNRANTDLKKQIRDELSSMIINSRVDSESEFEEIVL